MIAVARLIHLNGPPGIGKSTLARRYAAEHPGVLLCDVDVLRTQISGWRTTEESAARGRTIALAMITAYLRDGGDVVLPQLVARPDQLVRFTAAAVEASARHLHLVLTAEPEIVIKRFRDRARNSADDLTVHATQFWDRRGGDNAIVEASDRVQRMAGRKILSTSLEETYAVFLAEVAR